MSDALLKVASGLKMVFWGLMVMITAAVIILLGVCVLAVGAVGQAQQQGGAPPQNFLDGAQAFLIAVGGLYLIGFLVQLIGRFMCLAVPQEAAAAKQLIVIAVILELIGLAASGVNIANNFGGNFLPREAELAASIGSMIFSVAGLILFILFIRSLANFIGRRDLAGRAMSVIWLSVGAGLCYVVGIGVVFAGMWAAGGPGAPPPQGGAGGPGGAAAAGGCVGGLLMLATLVFGFIAFILYATLLMSSSNAVRAYARRGAYEGYEDDYGDYDDDDDDDDRRGRRDRDDRDRDDRDDYEDRGDRRPWDR